MHLNKWFIFYSALLMDIFQWIVSRNFPGKVSKVHVLFSTLWISKKNAKSFSTTEKTVNWPFLTYHQYPVSIVSTWRVQKIILLYFTVFRPLCGGDKDKSHVLKALNHVLSNGNKTISLIKASFKPWNFPLFRYLVGSVRYVKSIWTQRLYHVFANSEVAIEICKCRL